MGRKKGKVNAESGKRLKAVLRVLKTQYKITQEEVAEHIGITTQMISAITAGKNNLTASNADAIVKYVNDTTDLGLRIQYLLCIDDDMTHSSKIERAMNTDISREEWIGNTCTHFLRVLGYQFVREEEDIFEMLFNTQAVMNKQSVSIMDSSNNTVTAMTMREYIDFTNEIYEYMKFKFDFLIKSQRGKNVDFPDFLNLIKQAKSELSSDESLSVLTEKTIDLLDRTRAAGKINEEDFRELFGITAEGAEEDG